MLEGRIGYWPACSTRMNPRFSTVRDPRLRQVLESDYAELQLAHENQMSKASLVLAGGIVEAVLINYLLVIGYALPPKGTDPKNMQLGDLITACEAEGALTPETAALCHVLKHYRNMIHPGRSVRNDELADQSRAGVAERLVERVVADVAERARKRPEWAAEAVLEVAMDPALVEFDVAIRRQVRRLSQSEAERLVVNVLPDWFATRLPAKSTDEHWIEVTAVCRSCQCAGLGVVSAPVKVQAARRLLRELEKDSEDTADWLEAFFTSDLMEALDEAEREDLFSFVLQSWEWILFDGSTLQLDGIGPYLSAREVQDLVFDLAECLIADGEREHVREWASRTLLGEMPCLRSESTDAARQAMDAAVVRSASQPGDAARLSELRYRIWPLEDKDIPR